MRELKKKSSALEDPEIFHDEGIGNHSQASFCYSLNKMKTSLFKITDSSPGYKNPSFSQLEWWYHELLLFQNVPDPSNLLSSMEQYIVT